MMDLEQTNKVIKAFEKEVKRLLKLGKSPREAVRAAYKKYPVMETLREELEAQIIIEMARGSEYAFPEEVLAAAAAKPWAEDGLTLSDRTTKGSKAVVSQVAAAIGSCIKENQTTYATSRKLFDGYKKSGVIPEQDIPNFMHSLIRAAQPDMRHSPEFRRVLRNVTRNVEKLTTQGVKAAYNQITEAILSNNQKRLDNAIYVATQERTRYFAERIARTELARAYHDGVTARWDNDPDCVAYKWRMSQSHPVTDICDLYAGADLYGMGPGVFPKGKVPELPAHPHCMCYLRPLMDGSLHLKRQTPVEQVYEGGKEWLDKQSKTARQNILGVMGEMKYQKGGNWRSFARGYGSRRTKSRIPVLNINDGFKNRDIIKEAKKKLAYQKMIKNLPETYEQWPDIQKQRTIDECAYYANINHRNDREGNNNCQRSVIAYEMQRKGKNACAQNLSGEWKDDEIANDVGVAFVGSKTMYDLPGNGKTGVKTLLKNWGDGSRAAVSVNWPNLEYGHVFVVEYVDGGYVYVDPQTGQVGKSVEVFFDNAEKEHTSVMRLDNLKFKDKVLKKCCELVLEDK